MLRDSGTVLPRLRGVGFILLLGFVVLNLAMAQPKTTLGFVTFAGPGTHTAFTLQLVNEWAQEHNVEVRATTLPYGQLQNKIMTSMITEDPSVDFFYVDSGIMPLIARGLYPLNQDIEQDHFNLDIMAKTLTGLYTINNNIYAIPHESDTPLFVYRKDLFDNPEEQTAFKAKYGYALAPPTTTSQLLQVAQFFTRSAGQKLAGQVLTRPFYGIAIPGRTYISTARLYQMYLHGFGGAEFDQNLKPAFDNSAGQAALQYYTDLVTKYKVVPPGVLTVGTPEIVVLMNEGQVAMSATYPTGIGIGAKPGLEFDAAPFFPAMEKGWALGIAKWSKHKQLLWDLIKWMNSKDTQLKFGHMGGEPTRFDVLSDPALIKERPILGAMAETHRRALAQPQLAALPYLWDLWARPIADVISGKYNVAAALNHAAQDVETLMQQYQ